MSVMPAAELPWQIYRDVRLRALATDPGAFGSTSERELAFPDTRWAERAATPGTFLWTAPGAERVRADGLIGMRPGGFYLERPDSPAVRQTFGVDAGRLAFVTQMWVDPTQRGRGVFDALVDAALVHARGTDVDVVALHVYRSNERACAAYRRRGFSLISPTSPECPPEEAEYALRLDRGRVEKAAPGW